MATFTKTILSGSTDGRPVAVAATSSPGTTIHQAGTAIDQIQLSAVNVDTVERTLTLEHGGTSTSDQIKVTIPPGTVYDLPTTLLTNSLYVKAFADSANKINIVGEVNRIS